MTTTAVIIPTRYHSERLPGKVLIDINGKPNLQRIIERCLKANVDKVILAITEGDEKEIVQWYDKQMLWQDNKVQFIIGDHDNVFKRTLQAAELFGVDIIVDISHCCSLVNPYMINILIDRLKEYNADYSANCITRSWPDGYDVQVYTREIYERTYKEGLYWKPFWTGWNIWHCREELWPKPRVINFEVHAAHYYHPEWRLTLDTETDLKIIREIYKGIDRNQCSMSFWDEVNMIKNNPELLEMIENNKVQPTKLIEEGK